MFYAISKRRRDINAAEDRGREEGRLEGRQEGRREGLTTALDTLTARLKDDPDVNPMTVIAELRAQSQNHR